MNAGRCPEAGCASWRPAEIFWPSTISMASLLPTTKLRKPSISWTEGSCSESVMMSDLHPCWRIPCCYPSSKCRICLRHLREIDLLADLQALASSPITVRCRRMPGRRRHSPACRPTARATHACIIGVAPAGAEISTRPFQLVTGRVWKGTAFGGARGRTDMPKIVDWYMDGKIQIDPMITHTLPLDRINEGFDLMNQGKSIRAVVTS